MIPNLASDKECTGCFACMDACHKEALKIEKHADGHLFVNVLRNSCIGCGNCEKVCPVVSRFQYSESTRADFYAAWAKDRNARRNSASGGAFYAIAEAFINSGGIVFGAVTEPPCRIHHRDVDSVHALHVLQGSKYAHSNAFGSYQKTLNYLKGGKNVLFSGTGCQIAGLLSFLKGKRYSGTLMTIDLICGGVPSGVLVDKFIQESPYLIKKVLSFRTKDEGWKPKGFRYNLKVEDMDGIIHDYSNHKNLITNGFGLGFTNRYSCYDCRFVGVQRKSDFTIGDFWGIDRFTDEHYDGISLVIAHTEQADNFLNAIKETLFFERVDKALAIQNNRRLINGHDMKQYLPERRLLGFFASQVSNQVFSKIYAHTFKQNSPWILVKVCSKVIRIIIKIMDSLLGAFEHVYDSRGKFMGGCFVPLSLWGICNF